MHTRRPLHEVTRNVVATAMGREPADLLIRGGGLVNVNTAQIQEGVDLAVRDGYIACVGDASHIPVSAQTRVVDAGGRYLAPGLIDTHLHVESSMVDVRSYARAVLPEGTTTIACDNHEITNVFGLRAVELFSAAAADLPLKVLVAMPVCVPSIPGFEDAGAAITAADVARAYARGWAQLQGEQMNFPGVIYGDPAVHEILAASLRSGVVLTGHYSSPEIARGLPAFVAAGITADHEGTSADDALRRAQLGCYVQQRYGTAWLDMPRMIRAVLDDPELDTRFFTLITDDVTPATLVREGTMSRAVRAAIREGVAPVLALQMATLNAAQLLERSRWIGTLSPGRAADILLVSNLEALTIDQVYADGVLVAEAGEMVVEIPAYLYPEWALRSVHLAPLALEDLRIPHVGGAARVRVMRIHPGQVHTDLEIVEMRPAAGALAADPERDLAKVAVFYRHEPRAGATGTRGFGFVTGLQFGPHAAFGSTVAHDSHNLMVIGTADEEMVVAANELIRLGGGMVVVIGGRVRAAVPMPLAGLMSLEDAGTVARQVDGLEAALREAGCPAPNIEMTLSLLPLIVIPRLRVTNRETGLVELPPGEPPRFVPLTVS
jgi:adenine deaminase